MKALARLNHFYWEYKHLFIPGLLCTMASAAFLVAVPIVVREIIDSIPRFVELYNVFEGSEAQGTMFNLFSGGLLLFAGIIVALSLASGFFSFLMRQTIVVASRHIEFDLRNQLYDHLQRLSPKFYRDYTTGDVITRSTDDIEKVRRYVGPAIMYITRAIVVVATAITVMFIISPTLTLYALLPMPFLAVSIFFVARIVHKRSEALQKQYSNVTTRVQEALTGIRVIKSYTREDAENAAFEEESAQYRARQLDLAWVDSAWRPVLLLLVGASQVIVVWMGGRLVIDGAITIGNIAEYLIYVQMMTWPVASLGFVITMVQRASASMERLNELFDTEPEISDGPQTDYSITALEGHIAFENVSYYFEEGEEWALKDVSFEIPAGGTLAIVGRTGAGKSTLIDLIPRLIDPTEGTVRIDGHDVRTIPLDTLRSTMGYVPQDVFLFSDTVANNIAFGVTDPGEQRIRRAAQEADLLENIEEFPEGFDTFVGERGITLSGGQKQRSSIARALIRRPSILLLDDALSAVDTETETTILNHLRAQEGQHTLVMVSHRISAVQEADLILVLEHGHVTQQGTHDELVEQSGLYSDLYKKQRLQEQIEAL
ncbi:MAG: ATP-binding cassette domain-containing protein [Bacteroidetes bacterium]|jgi:ATP-binding cassette subfamily B protein|nr:ATP-binding cassette domain-containing protein [Bacteroidota bacterium]